MQLECRVSTHSVAAHWVDRYRLLIQPLGFAEVTHLRTGIGISSCTASRPGKTSMGFKVGGGGVEGWGLGVEG